MNAVLVAGGLVVKDGKLVLVKEAKSDVKGLLNLPMGKLDDNEKIIDAALREMQEETNLKLKLEKFIGVYQHPNRPPRDDHVIKFMFLASVIDGELKPQEGELEDAKWVSFLEFEKIPIEEHRDPINVKVVKDYIDGKLHPLDIVNCFENHKF